MGLVYRFSVSGPALFSPTYLPLPVQCSNTIVWSISVLLTGIYALLSGTQSSNTMILPISVLPSYVFLSANQEIRSMAKYDLFQFLQISASWHSAPQIRLRDHSLSNTYLFYDHEPRVKAHGTFHWSGQSHHCMYVLRSGTQF